MRPEPILWFERIIFGSLFLGVIQSYLSRHEAVALAAQTNPNPGAFVMAVQIGVFLVMGGLTLLISRRRSRVAMWVSIILFLLGLPAVAGLAARGLLFGNAWVTLLQTLGQIIAYGLLFTPAAREWLRGREKLDLERS